MNLQEFYDFHKLGRMHFASLCHVDYADLMAYESGRGVGEQTRLKIEIGMQIIEDYALTFESPNVFGEDFQKSQTRKLFEHEFKRITAMEL